MAPALTTSAPTAPHKLSSFPNHKAPRTIYPDGIKTSGQHPPLYDILRPYEDFPKKITGPTVWNVEDYRSTFCICCLPMPYPQSIHSCFFGGLELINAAHPEQWTHVLSPSEIQEISSTADAFLASGTPLTGISRENFQLKEFGSFLGVLRKELIDGKGFILFKGLPVREWGNHKSAVAYMVRPLPSPLPAPQQLD